MLVGCGGNPDETVERQQQALSEVEVAQQLLQAKDDEVQSDLPPDVRAQTNTEAREADLGLIAQASGWTLEQAAHFDRLSR